MNMNRNHLELRHLRTLSALAETGSLAKAASRVFLTPSALSHQLKDLERCYGVALVARGRPLGLTAAGRILADAGEGIFRALREAETRIGRAGDERFGELRIAVECHSCFDWLMPAMDTYRRKWPRVEMDLVSGFHPDPVGLIKEGKADLVIVSRKEKREDAAYHALFRYEVPGILAKDHPLAKKAWLLPQDFAGETFITYPVPDDRLDAVRDFLAPAKVYPSRRTTQMTAAILQLVASRRGVAALPGWAVQSYLHRGYVAARRLGSKGLYATLYAAVPRALEGKPYLTAFLKTMKDISFKTLEGIQPI
jgi:LysR family transcriptional regulator, regulator for metE and metH